MSKRRALRATVAFFSLLLLCTFCSRAVYRALTPRVRVCAPTGGTLSFVLQAAEFAFESDAVLYAGLDASLPSPLTVRGALVAPGDGVSAGEGLIAFYEAEGEAALAGAISRRAEAEEARARFALDLAEAVAAARKALGECETQAESARLCAEMELLQKGVLPGGSERAVFERIREAEAAVACLEALRDEGWVYPSPADATVLSVSVREGEAYAGRMPLCALAEEGAAVALYAEMKGLPDEAGPEWRWTAAVRTPGGDVPAEVLSVGRRGVRVALPEGLRAGEARSLTVRTESPYIDLLLPNAVISDQKVFLLESAVGDWGRPVLRVREVAVAAGRSDGARTAILAGVSRDSRVVASCTKPISHGATVLMDSYD